MSEIVANQIKSAFMSSVLPTDDPVSVPTYDDEGTAIHFKGTHWSTHSLQSLSEFTHSTVFFTPAATAFFLPAFMLSALESPNSGVADAVIGLLTPPKGNPKRPSYSAWWSLLSSPQQAVVVAFLRAMPNESHPECSAVANALENDCNRS